jgi:hypothetical protein
MYLGGLGLSRNMVWPHHAVSYEGLYPGFAALVTINRDDHLRVTLYNLADQPKSGLMRVWRLVPGKYQVTSGPDDNGDDAPDAPGEARSMDLLRHEAIPLTLPPRRAWVVEAKLLEKHTPLWERPDLAVTYLDATFAAATRRLDFAVHNMGTRPSGPYCVRVLAEDGKELLNQKMNSLEPPLDCRARIARVSVPNIPPASRTVRVEVASLKPTEEITLCNNTETIPLNALPPAPLPFGWAMPVR